MKRLIIGLLLAGLVLTGCAGGGGAPKLRSISVSFDQPHGSSRKATTAIDVRLEEINFDTSNKTSFHSVVVGNNIAPGEEFRGGRTYGPYPLSIIPGAENAGNYKYASKFSAFYAYLTITPQGNESWMTKMIFNATYSDGSMDTWTSSQTAYLDEDGRTAQVWFHNSGK